MRAWFVSDVHIKELNERNSHKLLRFLNSIAEGERPATHLYLLGDIFDLWAGDSEVFADKFRPFVDALSKIRRSGIEVGYFEGNHDIHIRKFWEKLGIAVWDREKYVDLDGVLVRMEHGDFINPNDKAYERFRRFMRSKLMEVVAYNLPGLAIEAIGNWGSRKSRKHSSVRRKDHQEDFRRMIREYAKKAFAQGAFDYIFSGHMHIRDEHSWQDGHRKVTSINLGSWFDEPKVLELTKTGYQWVAV